MLTENKLQSKNGLFAVMAAFLLSFFLFNDLGIRYIFGYAVLGVILLALAIKSKFAVYFSAEKLLFVFMVIVTAVFSVLPNSNLGHLVISLSISMLMFTGYYIFMAPGTKVLYRFFIALHILCVFFSVYLFVVKLFPEFYWNHIYKYLGEYTREIAARFIPQGYGVPIGGSTTYAAYMIFIALISNMGLLLINGLPKTVKNRIFFFATSILYFASIMLTNRRSEGLGTIAAMGIMFLLSISIHTKGDLRKKLIIMVIAIVLIIAIVLGLAACGFLVRYNDLVGFIAPDVQDPSLPDDPLPDEELTADEVSGGRLALWSQAGSLFLKNPVLGIGWEQFMNYNENEHDVHNTYLQWLCEAGVIGFVLLFVPLVSIYVLTLKRMLRIKKADNVCKQAKILNFISLAMQTFYLLINVLDPAYYHLNYFCFFALALVLNDTAAKLETIDTGVEHDCLRNRLLPKLSKLKIFY